MLHTFEYRSTRALQICIVFVTALVLERMLNYSRAGWIGFIVMMIYVGFDSGASIHRTMHRFWGTVLGLVLSYFLWQLGLLDFRLMLTVIPIVIFLSFFAFFSVHSLTHFRNNTLKQLQDALDARPVVLIVEFADGAKRIRHVVTRIDFLSWTFERIVAKTKA